MNLLSKFFYLTQKIWKSIRLYLMLSGPGLVVMVADNDAGGITTYAATGAKYGYGLIWFLLILIPVAYYVQEMTVRLGAVTKRGHAEAIFEGFGAFWGWFSLLDLLLVDWLALVTEFIGMTSALSIFGIPPWLTVVAVCVLMGVMVLNGRYWTWEKIALLFCALNLIYIPGAFMVQPRLADIVHTGLIPHWPGGEEVEPRVQRELISSLSIDKAVELIEQMTAAQAADIIDILPVAEAQQILARLDRGLADRIAVLTRHHDETASLYMLPGFIAFPPTALALEVLDSYREVARDKDVVMYIYVVDGDGRLLGVLDIRELLQAEPESPLSEIMNTKIVRFAPGDSLREVSQAFARYSFRAIPVTDENDRLQGVIPYRDVMNLKHRYV